MASHIRYYNGTPHAISIFKDGNPVRVFESNGEVRLEQNPGSCVVPPSLLSQDFPIVPAPIYIGVSGLPAYSPEIALIVSMPVGNYFKENPELWPGIVLGPDTSPSAAVRDSAGRIVGVLGLVIYRGGEPYPDRGAVVEGMVKVTLNLI